MSENKKYYYLKLKEDFFDSEKMTILESLPNGIIFSNILLKLYLKSLKREGKLMITDAIPYNIHALSAVVRQSESVVKDALATFQQLELIEVLDDGAIFLSNIQEFIGNSTTEADRKRQYRARIEEEASKNGGKLGVGKIDPQSLNGTNVRTNVQKVEDNGTTFSENVQTNVHQRLEYRDKSIDKRDITILTDSNIEKSDKCPTSPSESPSKKKGRKVFVPPTPEEVEAYAREKGYSIDAQYFVDRYQMVDWKTTSGVPIKDWKAAVRQWVRRDKKWAEERQAKQGNQPKHKYHVPDYFERMGIDKNGGNQNG